MSKNWRISSFSGVLLAAPDDDVASLVPLIDAAVG